MWKFLLYEDKIPPWGGIPPRLGTTALNSLTNKLQVIFHAKLLSNIRTAEYTLFYHCI